MKEDIGREILIFVALLLLVSLCVRMLTKAIRTTPQDVSERRFPSLNVRGDMDGGEEGLAIVMNEIGRRKDFLGLCMYSSGVGFGHLANTRGKQLQLNT
jgi:hypothetical protein